MKQIITNITTCQKCPHFESSRYYTSDSWEHASYWWCKHPHVEEVECDDKRDERERIAITNTGYNKARKIQGYVEWHDEDRIKIPIWCPLSDGPII